MLNWQEGIGYLASLLVAISLLMVSIKRLRWINMAGAFVFIIYGLLIGSWPVMVMNLFLVVVNAWFILKMRNTAVKLHLKKEDWSDALVRKFMCSHHAALQQNYPDFDYIREKNALFLIYNAFEIAGFITGEVKERHLEIQAIYMDSKYNGYPIADKLFLNNNLVLRAFHADTYAFIASYEASRHYVNKNNLIP